MKILYVKHSSTRAKEFQLTTIIYEVDGIKYVKKEAATKEAIPHLQKIIANAAKLEKAIVNPQIKLAKIISSDEKSLIFEFIQGESLEQKFQRLIIKDKPQGYKLVEEYREMLRKSFKTSNKVADLENAYSYQIFGDTVYSENTLCFEEHSNIDLLFSNIIEQDEVFYLIDYEWVFDFPLSVDYVAYRAISQLYHQELLEKSFDAITLENFAQMEKSFILGYVLNKNSFFQKQHDYLKNKLNLNHELKWRDDTIARQNEAIKYREQVIAEKDETINLVIAQSEQHKVEQAHYQEQLINQIRELEDIAQSLRIKNRIKRLYPSTTVNAAKSVVKNPILLKKAFFHIKQGNFAFLYSRTKEKLSAPVEKIDKELLIDPKEYFEPFDAKKYSLGELCVDIIIPVYDGMSFLPNLFDSVKANTTSSYRLIVVNDCSPDERVKPYLLERLKEHPTAIFIDNEVNLGFLKSVNKAREHISNHFLILNTDTEVPSFWLERMMYPILQMENIASTTPFTNSGEIASFPNFIADNPIFEGMSTEELDGAFREIKPEAFYEPMPTGVGFCMGVNYHLTQEIGFFREDKFGKGYGEENDWCQRAIKNGYKNLLVPNLFVYHKHGGSFSAEEKQKLLNENLVKLTKIHANYTADVHGYIARDPHQLLRQVLIITASSRVDEGISLIVDHNLGGGANHYRKELVAEYKANQKKVLQLLYDFYTHEYRLIFEYKGYNISFSIETLEDVEEFMGHIIIKEVFLNELVSFPRSKEMLSWIETLIVSDTTQLVIPIHDYYPICPSYTLLDAKGEFCDIPSLEQCKKCMQNNKHEWRTYFSGNVDMHQWREEWSRLLRRASKVLCFSHSTGLLLQKAYPALEKEKILIQPHKVAPLGVARRDNLGAKSEIVVGVLGALNYSKGSQFLADFVKEIEKKNLPIRVVLIGELDRQIHSDRFKSTGRYARDELPKMVEIYEIDLFLIPSVWPETFSYTTQEIIMMDMPLVVFDLGAPAERVAKYEKGIVLPKEYMTNLLKHLESLRGQ